MHKLIADKYSKGRVINDKLVKVRLKDGDEKWILIHIEVQSSFETRFAERMFTYFYRIYDKYDEKITTIAIYSGEKTPRGYDRFEYEFLGTSNLYKFNTYKIVEPAENDLLVSENPFSLVILASQYLLKTRSDYNERYSFKHKLIRLAKEKMFSDYQIVNLSRFIDLILILPEELEIKFEEEIIHEHIKPKGMVTRKSERFANQLHLALYGESLIEKVKKEKTLIVQNLLRIEGLTMGQIADAVNESIEYIEKIKENLEKN